MKDNDRTAEGYLSLLLHAHLPYVLNHGTWPHGIEWLHEAAAETYLPLLAMLGRLERDGVPFRANLNLTPVLLEQMAHPLFLTEFPQYLTRKMVAAQEDEAYFTQSGELHFAETARLWIRFFSGTLHQFQALDEDIVAGFRHFSEAGMLDLLTSGATHGYLPLLGTDESVRGQLGTATACHQRHLGRVPRGVWLPECGYRPAGPWTFPVGNADGSPQPPTSDRPGLEDAVREAGLRFFFVDTHLIEHSQRTASPYDEQWVPPGEGAPPETAERLYRPHWVDNDEESSVNGGGGVTTVFARDPRTGLQVWSGDTGYPGESQYLDFHKKRWPGGHRYWRVTGHRVSMGDKQPYSAAAAGERIREHARHFVGLVRQTLEPLLGAEVPPVLTAPFDAELFGHWWFEGIAWLEEVAREIDRQSPSDQRAPLRMTTAAGYLERHPPADAVRLPAGSWGASGSDQVWLNPETAWTWSRIYPAELFTRAMASSGTWQESDIGGRLARQICRELLLLESSDWQFLITTGAARDYAELRFVTHEEQFGRLRSLWEEFVDRGELGEDGLALLSEIENRDSIFPAIDPALWMERPAFAELTDPAAAEVAVTGVSAGELHGGAED